MAVRIKNVAEEASAAMATVSRVMDSRRTISEKTRNKIWNAIQELGYHPSQIARNLQSQKTGIVGIVIPDVGHNSFTREIRYLEGALCEHGYKTMLCSTTHQRSPERDYIRMLQCSKVDGIILASHALRNEVYEKLNLPLVSLDRYLGENTPVVTSDHYQGGMLAENALAENRCKCVAQICGNVQIAKPSDDRHTIVEAVLKKAGIWCERMETLTNIFEYDDYKELVSDLFDQYPETDGIFCIGNITCAVLQEAAKRGIPVPEKLKVMGYDGNDVSRMTAPVLATAEQQMESLAKQTIDILMEQVEGSKVVGVYKIPVLLVKGGSAV